MTSLFFRNLVFHARSHLGALLGVFIATAVLVGALAVGDCVRASLTSLALQRLGKVEDVIAPGDHFFRAQLADDLRPSISNKLATAILQLPGIAIAPDGSARANQVQILGVSDSFWPLAQTPALFAIPSNSVILNEPLARQLHVHFGDSILLRAQKPSLLSSEAPLSPREDVASAARLTVAAIVTDDQFGRFSLQVSSAPVFNAFVPISLLQEKSELPGKANLLLSGPLLPGVDLAATIRQKWRLADASLELTNYPGGEELRSDRVFIGPEILNAIAPAIPSSHDILTYFVNELRDGSHATPYSMVAAAGAPWTGRLPDDEILISQWLADDLGAHAGDQLTLKYFVLSDSHRLEEKERAFRIHSIVEHRLPWTDRTLMPDFPGIAKAEKTENWDAGFRIDVTKIRPKDEQYWKQFRGTPKAFITLRAGQQMWGNRFGDVTAVRFSASSFAESNLLARLDPASVGLTPRPVRELALAAVSQAEDLGQYFLAFSFFIVTAALILLALLFQFGLEQRATEIGVLLGLGWPVWKVRSLLLGEGIIIAAVGGALGVAGGVLYARLILWGLANFWGAAVNHTQLGFHVTEPTLLTGSGSGLIVSVIVIWFALRSQTRRPARELLDRPVELETPPSKKRKNWAAIIAVLAGLEGTGQLVFALCERAHPSATLLLSAGALLLCAGLCGASAVIRRFQDARASQALTVFALGLRGVARRRRRSVATIALLACGAFIIVTVAGNKIDAHQDGSLRSSGTGGFAFIGESALPVVQDLNTTEGRAFFGLHEELLTNASLVPFRVHAGDDASCLNLNHAQTPRLLGVDPKLLAERRAFTFVTPPRDGWLSLTNAADEIPAVAADASITYSMHKSVGDTLDYLDEHGRPFKVKLVGSLANSVLQGNLIIDESAFLRRFPGDDGARFFLIDCPRDSYPAGKFANAATVSLTMELTRGLQDRGLQLTDAADRLNEFNAVQNSYLDTFQALGGLGLLLGSFGVGVVVLRNVLERRPELAAMAAMGFRRRVLAKLILSEHAALEIVGLFIGSVVAALAILPVLLSPRAQISWLSLLVTLAAVFITGILWTWIATRLALRGPLLEALRDE